MVVGKKRNEFIIRLIIPTAIMLAALCYLGSLWDARMRDKNLVLIQPVVIAMIPFYIWVIGFEIQKYRNASTANEPPKPVIVRTGHLKLMAISVVGVALFYLFGAIPASIISLAGSLLILGVRNVSTLILVPATVTAVLWLVFIELFGIRMPLFLLPW